MSRIAVSAAQRPRIQQIANDLVGDNDLHTAKNVWNYVRARVRFQADEATSLDLPGSSPDDEIVVEPEALLDRGAGDCDDQSTLAAALLIAAGLPAAFITVAAGQRPEFTHVYAATVLEDGQIYPLDCSHGPQPGWAIRTNGKEQIWPVLQGDDCNCLAAQENLAGIDWGAIISSATSAATDIARARYAQPPAGTYLQTPQGTLYRQPPNAGPLAFPGAGFNLGGIPTWAILGVSAIGLFALLRK